MRPQPPSQRLLLPWTPLLALLLLLSFGQRCGAALQSTAVTAASLPAYTLPLPVSCGASFLDFDAGLNDTQADRLSLTSIAAHCPANCTQQVLTFDVGTSVSHFPPVYGSFPYHGRSSLCLAAIHAGLLSAEKGGGVFVSRYYPADWSNSSTQTIFPHTSSLGSTSNGVRSEDVDGGWYSVPSNRSSEWSYTVRGRGDFVAQRQQAPWGARAGHLHQLLQGDRLHLHLIMSASYLALLLHP